jgi:hypothetical protein
MWLKFDIRSVNWEKSLDLEKTFGFYLFAHRSVWKKVASM